MKNMNTKTTKSTKKVVAGTPKAVRSATSFDAKIYNTEGKEVSSIVLPEEIFGVKWNDDLVHQVITSMRSSMRSPIAHTKTRGEVSGGGKKPWKQKGTGRARHGSTRSPIWVHGGVAHGPRNDKNFDRKINKQVKDKALRAILSRKLRDGEILFVESFNFASPKTSDAKKVVSALAGVTGFEKLTTKPKNVALITTPMRNEAVYKSFRNFGNIAVEEFRNLNPLSVVSYKYLIVSMPDESLKFFKEEAAKADKTK